MLITGTSDKIQVVLEAAITTSQLSFTSHYNNYTSTSSALNTTNGTTNSTTAVDIVPSPSSNQQNQLRYCSIFNSDTANANIRIQVFDGTNTRVIFRATLAPGELLQYQLEKGWEVLDAQGNRETTIWNSFTNTINGAWGWRVAGVASAAAPTSGQVLLDTLGKADKAYTSFDIMYNVTTQASSITWAEMAIYSAQRFNSDTALPFIRRGFTDTSGSWNSTGIKRTTITTSGIVPGEQLVVAFGYVGTGLQLRSMGWGPLDISDATFGSMGNNTNWRPSQNSYLYYGAYNQALYYLNWQAT